MDDCVIESNSIIAAGACCYPKEPIVAIQKYLLQDASKENKIYLVHS